MKIWTNGSDWVAATDLEERRAIQLLRTGEFRPDDWAHLDDTDCLQMTKDPLWASASGEATITRTAAEWAADFVGTPHDEDRLLASEDY